ncbi:MAG: aminotransferase class IV [Verrucomicrobiota bacterium]
MLPLTVSGPAAYLNGQFIPTADCRLPISDTGIVFGAAVADLARTFNGQLYRLEDHARRFFASAEAAHLVPPHSLEEICTLARALVTHNYQREQTLVMYLTGGANPVYAGTTGLPAEPKPTFVMHTFPTPVHLWRNFFLTGGQCITPAMRHSQCLPAQIKHRNRLHMWIGEREVKQVDPAAVPLYLDVHDHIAETGVSNFVIYRNGTVFSPRRANILWGVSLTVLTEILAEMQISFAEADLTVATVHAAEEAWLPMTTCCLAPVTKLNGQLIGTGQPGLMWRRILDRWSQLTGKDVYREVTTA